MKLHYRIGLLLLGLSCGFGSAFAWPQVTLDTVVEVEKNGIDESGRAYVEYHEAAIVVPGDVLRFTVTARNGSRKSASIPRLSHTIPERMLYIEDSARISRTNLQGKLQFSLDGGKTWGATSLPKTDDARAAAAGDYRALGWLLDKPLAPSESLRFWYKARLQ